MKKTLHVGIAGYETMKSRTMAIARGQLKPKRDDPKVWFTSIESFAKFYRIEIALSSRSSSRRSPPRLPSW
jgi:predicted transcriptional regulator